MAMSSNGHNVDSRFQPNVCVKRRCDGEDRISQLPDDILIGILCWLPLKGAALTGAISSRWRDLWKHYSRLNFDAGSVLYKISMMPKCEERIESRRVELHKYVKWVNQVLKSHRALTLKEFRICFDLDQSTATAINKWLEFAFSRQVERLELEALDNGEARVSWFRNYVFPEEQLLRPNKFIGGSIVKVLSLKGVDVTGEAVKFFLRNCPSLEHLVIQGSSKLINLDVCGPSLLLKHLEVVCCPFVEFIKVSAPNLSSLAIPLSMNMNTKSVLLENVPSLVKLSVACMYVLPSSTFLFPVFLSSFSKLEVLTLSSLHDLDYFYEVFNMLRFPQLKRFEIEISAARFETPLYGLTSMIRACPYLQEFVLKCLWVQGFATNMRGFDEIDTPQFCHRHLKVFMFLGYYGCSNDFEFVRFISVNCVVLEKIVIDPHFQYPWYCPPREPLPETKKEWTARNNANKLIQAKVVPHNIQILII